MKMGCAKIFPKRGRVLQKKPRRGRGVLLGPLSIRNDSEGPRQGTSLAESQSMGPIKLASASHHHGHSRHPGTAGICEGQYLT